MRVVLKYRSSFSAGSTKKLAQRPTGTPAAPQKETRLASDVPAYSEPDVQTALYCTRLSFKSAAKASRCLFQIEERRQFAHLMLKARQKQIFHVIVCVYTYQSHVHTFVEKSKSPNRVLR
jgi:hypothetical protein